jgi:hypothetical protein
MKRAVVWRVMVYPVAAGAITCFLVFNASFRQADKLDLVKWFLIALFMNEVLVLMPKLFPRSFGRLRPTIAVAWPCTRILVFAAYVAVFLVGAFV